MNILLTGGLGFIGSHTALVLTQQGHQVTILDNLCNSQIGMLASLEKIAGQKLPFYETDVRDGQMLGQVLSENQIEAVMHFAGLKSVAESETDPLKYYDNNVGGTISLIEAMQAQRINKLIFSSSATVYGVPQYLPYDENHPLVPINTYGKTKLQAEQIMQDLVSSDASWSVTALRYFNPVGAHESGLIGELPRGMPNNLMPYICQVASGKRPTLNIFGDDYDTKDGTGERDYIHVMDLAEAHIAAIHYINQHQGYLCLNIGTGNSYSVFDLLKAFEKVIGKEIPFQIAPRRSGDLPRYFADPSLAKKILHWSTKRTLKEMCHSTWKYKSQVMDNES